MLDVDIIVQAYRRTFIWIFFIFGSVLVKKKKTAKVHPGKSSIGADITLPLRR